MIGKQMRNLPLRLKEEHPPHVLVIDPSNTPQLNNAPLKRKTPVPLMSLQLPEEIQTTQQQETQDLS